MWKGGGVMSRRSQALARVMSTNALENQALTKMRLSGESVVSVRSHGDTRQIADDGRIRDSGKGNMLLRQMLRRVQIDVGKGGKSWKWQLKPF